MSRLSKMHFFLLTYLYFWESSLFLCAYFSETLALVPFLSLFHVFFSQSLHFLTKICFSIVWAWCWCAMPGATPSSHATWIPLEREVECIQVKWSNKSAGFVSSVWNMNIKHIRIMWRGKYVTPVIPSDLPVSSGLCFAERRGKFTRMCEAFRWRSPSRVTQWL